MMSQLCLDEACSTSFHIYYVLITVLLQTLLSSKKWCFTLKTKKPLLISQAGAENGF